MILRAVRRAGGTVRSISEAKRYLSNEQEVRIAEAYAAGESSRVLATQYGANVNAVLAAVRRQGVNVRPVGFSSWKGGRRAPDSYGYVRVMIPADHPMYEMCDVTRTVFEHRLVMAEFLGRPLLPSESVHHRNGDRADNRLENLQLRARAHGMGHTHRCIDCGSVNIEHTDL